jgi:hypothetical protein
MQLVRVQLRVARTGLQIGIYVKNTSSSGTLPLVDHVETYQIIPLWLHFGDNGTVCMYGIHTVASNNALLLLADVLVIYFVPNGPQLPSPKYQVSSIARRCLCVGRCVPNPGTPVPTVPVVSCAG